MHCLPWSDCSVTHGVTTYFPTTVTAPVDQTLQALERLADAIEHAAEPAKSHGHGRSASIWKVLSSATFAPASIPPADLLPPTLKMFERFWQAARGHIKVMTIAPELEGAIALIAEANPAGRVRQHGSLRCECGGRASRRCRRRPTCYALVQRDAPSRTSGSRESSVRP